MVASDWLAAELVAAGLPADRLRVVPPGKDLDVAAVGPTGEDDIGRIDRASLRRGRLIAAVCVANWLPRKGIVELLDAVAGLPDDVVTLHLVGDTATRGGYAGRVRERIEHADLRDRVVVHGLILPAAVHRMYQTVDAFVLPSFEEPYGTVWGEAMAAGLPVVGWQAGNLPFLADHGRDGVLVPVGTSRPSWCDRVAGPRPSASRAAGTRRRRPRSSASNVGRDGSTLLRDHPGSVVRAPRTCSATRARSLTTPGASPATDIPAEPRRMRIASSPRRVAAATCAGSSSTRTASAGDAEVAHGEDEQVRLDGPGVAGGEDGVDEPVEPECGITPAASAEAFVTIASRAPACRSRPSVGTTSGYRRTPTPVGPLSRSELGQQVVRDLIRPGAARRREDRRQVPFERAMLATHPRFVGSGPCRVRCRSRHADAIGNRVTPGGERAPVRLDEGPVEVEENGPCHGRSPAGRSTDAHASADS